MQMNARSQATVCFLFMPLPSLWWMYPVKYFCIMHTILFWTVVCYRNHFSVALCRAVFQHLLPSWLFSSPLGCHSSSVHPVLYRLLFPVSFPVLFPSLRSLSPSLPPPLSPSHSLSGLSVSLSLSVGLMWDWLSLRIQPSSKAECGWMRASHWGSDLALVNEPPLLPLSSSSSSSSSLLRHPSSLPPFLLFFLRLATSHITFLSHLLCCLLLLLLQPICCSYGFLSILSFICISAFQHPRLPLCLVPQSLHSPSATVPLQAQLQTEAGVCLSVSDSPPPPFPLPPFLTTTSTITAPMIHTLPRSLAADPVFNHCKHSSTSQPHCCKCTYATCMQMQKLNTGGQLASCHIFS